MGRWVEARMQLGEEFQDDAKALSVRVQSLLIQDGWGAKLEQWDVRVVDEVNTDE